jgi:hypothetical protein
LKRKWIFLRSISEATMKLDSLKQRIEELQSVARSGWIPSTDANGNRAWIKDRGCGIRFMFEILKWQRDGGELSQDQQEQLDLWSRAEVNREKFGDIARANRELARDVLGLEHGAHL